MLPAKIWMSGKSFKVLKDEELLVPVSKNREKKGTQRSLYLLIFVLNLN